MAGRGAGHELPHPGGRELHVRASGEGPDWELLLLPVAGLPQGGGRIRRLKNPQPTQDPGALPPARRGLYHLGRRLVQGQSHGQSINDLSHPFFLVF